jgi:queuine tRNA-ribosyltransferase
MTDRPRDPDVLPLPHGDLPLPAFLPDATRAVVRSVDSADLEGCGVNALVMNTFHLMQHPGSTTIKALGGLHQMSGWPHPIMTDSGGFQIYSLIRENPKYGRLNDKGAVFTTEGSDRKFNLTPEKSIQLQMGYGADILVCLDDCTHADDSLDEQRKSVKRTVDWARRSKVEFKRLCDEKRLAGTDRPLLFAVIQGGGDRDLRRQCAESLLEIGFDGFGYGGWPLDGEGKLLVDMLSLTRELVPPEFPLHALGVGHPANVVECARMGYPMFDSAMPTRDARNARLYAFTTDDPRMIGQTGGGWFEYVYVGDDRHIKGSEPVSAFCDCACCARYSLGYLHHLFKINDTLFMRLATIHNLRFMMQLAGHLRGIGRG